MAPCRASLPSGRRKVSRGRLDSGARLRLDYPVALTQADKEFYWENGYVLLPGLVAPGMLDRLESRFLDLVGGASAAPGMVLMRDVMVAKGAVAPRDPVYAINKLLSFENDPLLFAYALDPEMLASVRDLIGTRLQTISTNIFNKPPEIDGRHPLHQDLRYFALRPGDGILGTWTAISEVRRQNGCLAIIPGSHRAGILPHERPAWEFVNSGFLGAAGVDLDRRVHVEMEPGDTLFMHPLLVHGSGRNRSRGCRRAISVHYASRECRRPAGKPKRAPVIRAIPDPASASGSPPE